MQNFPFRAVEVFRGSRFISSSTKMGPICCPALSIRNYQLTLRNMPSGRRFLLKLYVVEC